MILTLGCLALLVIGVLSWMFLNKGYGFWGFFPFMCTLLGGIGFAICLLVTIINPIGIRSEIAELDAVIASVEGARNNPDVSKFEMATLQLKIIERNEWLASCQFWAKHKLTNWFWPKAIHELKPIK